MRRLFILLVMTVSVVMGISAQNNYVGQAATVKLASGDSLTVEMGLHGIVPRVKDGKIVWRFRDY